MVQSDLHVVPKLEGTTAQQIIEKAQALMDESHEIRETHLKILSLVFMEELGCGPDEMELVETRDGNSTKWRFKMCD